MTAVKICGLRTVEEVDAAIEAGAEYLGFNTFPKSPRYVDPARLGALLAHSAGRTRRVLLLVDPTDAELDAAAALGPEFIQLHGRETPERATEARARTGLPVIKALPVATAEDLHAVGSYNADHVMLDAKPPAGADRQGGHGVPFDWSLLHQGDSNSPGLRVGGEDRGTWFLAGGLTPANVAEAIRVTRAPVVDVSSGVESAPGVKDAALIRAFIRAAKEA